MVVVLRETDQAMTHVQCAGGTALELVAQHRLEVVLRDVDDEGITRVVRE